MSVTSHSALVPTNRSASRRSKAKSHIDHGLRRQCIVESLLTEVVQGKLHANQHLVTQDLAERFGVSHTPIREALIALAGMGIIELLPNRGAVVRPVTARDVREISHVRNILESAAVKSACGRFVGRELDDLSTELRQLKGQTTGNAATFVRRARKLDNRLHDLIAQRCGNSFLANEIGRLKLLFRVFRDVAWSQHQARNDLHRLAEEADEHLAIVEALRRGEGKAAASAMTKHIRAGTRYWARALVEAT